MRCTGSPGDPRRGPRSQVWLASIWWMTIGLPAKSIRGLGMVRVRGRMRVPKPPGRGEHGVAPRTRAVREYKPQSEENPISSFGPYPPLIDAPSSNRVQGKVQC